MHPFVNCEYQQTKRGLLLMLLFMVCAGFGLRFLTGSIGIVMVILLGVPQLSAIIGVGTFSEEYTKGTLRFLYGLPISRRSMWWTKFISGLLGIALCTACAAAPLLINPTENLEQLTHAIADAGYTWTQVAALVGAYVLFNFGAGYLAVHACMSPKFAAFICSVTGSLVILTGGGVVVLFGIIPSPWIVIALLTLAAIVLHIGSYVVFLNRNPFLATPWRCRGIAAGFVLATCSIIAIGAATLPGDSAALAERLPLEAQSISPSPDGQTLAVFTSTKIGIPGPVLILDRDGRTIGQTIPARASVGASHAWAVARGPDWLFMTPDSISIIDRYRGGKLPAEPSVLCNWRTGEQAALPWPDSGFTNVRASLTHGSFIGARLHREPEGIHTLKTSYFHWNPSSGALKEIPLDDNTHVVALSERHVVCRPLGSINDKHELTLVDVGTQKRSQIEFPASTVETCVSDDAKSVAYVQSIIVGQTLEYEMILRDIETGAERTLLKGEGMPKTPAGAVGRGSIPFFQLSFSPAGRWVRMEIRGAKPEDSIVSTADGKRHVLGTEVVSMVDWFADDTRLTRVHQGSQPMEPAKPNLTVFDTTTETLTKLREFGGDKWFASVQWLDRDRLLALCLTVGRMQDRKESYEVLTISDGTQRALFPDGVKRYKREESGAR